MDQVGQAIDRYEWAIGHFSTESNLVLQTRDDQSFLYRGEFLCFSSCSNSALHFVSPPEA